ncbi:MAG: transposase, partial [Balneolaceae bacterium]|nr:transposase [Balneolaceae bacterium]
NGILKNLDCPALIINSVPDHIHILFRLSKNHALASVVQEVKKVSSKWMKVNGPKNQTFKWQIGYGAFSVSSSKVEIVRRYIRNQKRHHQRVNYKQELEKFLDEYDLHEYNPEYFWR